MCSLHTGSGLLCLPMIFPQRIGESPKTFMRHYENTHGAMKQHV